MLAPLSSISLAIFTARSCSGGILISLAIAILVWVHTGTSVFPHSTHFYRFPLATALLISSTISSPNLATVGTLRSSRAGFSQGLA